MTARCTHCSRIWIISIRTSPVGYVYPDCEWRDKLVRAGVVKPTEAGGEEVQKACRQRDIDTDGEWEPLLEKPKMLYSGNCASETFCTVYDWHY